MVIWVRDIITNSSSYNIISEKLLTFIFYFAAIKQFKVSQKYSKLSAPESRILIPPA